MSLIKIKKDASESPLNLHAWGTLTSKTIMQQNAKVTTIPSANA
jgi:hypothetical protein